MKKLEIKNNKAITLIALVITIVVMLIIVGITIRLVTQGGLLDRSKNASDTYNSAAQKERLSVILTDCKTEKLIDSSTDFATYVKSKGVDEVFEEEDTYTVEYSGTNYIVDKETYKILDSKLKKQINGIASVGITLNDLISSSELKITSNVQYNQGVSSIEISQYKYFVYKNNSLVASSSTTDDNWTATGLTAGDSYTIYVIVLDNEGGTFKSSETEYTKKQVYAWNKYEAEKGDLINYTYTKSGSSWNQTDDNSFLYNTDYQIVSNIDTCFDSTTGTWTADSVINSEDGYQKIGWKLILRGNKVVDLRSMTNYGTFSGGLYLVPYSVYTSVANYEYHQKSNTPVGDPVTSNDPNAYPTAEGGGYKNGYWYVKISE